LSDRKRLNGTWLPTAGSEGLDAPTFERYSQAVNARDPNSEFEIYILIRK